MEDFTMVEIQSSTMTSIGYKEDIETLRIQFINGDLYEYFNFPIMEYNLFAESTSKGQYFNNNIRNKYPYNKIG